MMSRGGSNQQNIISVRKLNYINDRDSDASPEELPKYGRDSTANYLKSGELQVLENDSSA